MGSSSIVRIAYILYQINIVHINEYNYRVWCGGSCDEKNSESNCLTLTSFRAE